MVTIAVLALGLGALAGALVALRYGLEVLALLTLLATMTLVPLTLAGGGDPNHSGIANSAPSISTYGITLGAVGYLLVLRAVAGRTDQLVPPVVLWFGAFLVFGLFGLWNGSAAQVAGTIQLLFGFAAWACGAFLAPRILSRPDRIYAIALAVLGIVVLQSVVAFAQRAGLPLNPMPPDLAVLMGDRVNGTMNHPNNLGKVMLILIVLCLGLMGSDDRRTRIALWGAIFLAFIPLGLSQGRANIVAAGLTLGAWAALSPRTRPIGLRLGVPLAAAVAALPFVGAIVGRFGDDPEGGARSKLSDVAIEQIGMRPWSGTGVNSYVEVVSAFDPLTATGYPVHNAFLLTAAEMGVVGSVLFWAPVLWLIGMSWNARHDQGLRGSFALATVAFVPGAYLVNATGWAFLTASLLPLWFLVLGVSYSVVRVRPSIVVPEPTTGPKPAAHQSIPT